MASVSPAIEAEDTALITDDSEVSTSCSLSPLDLHSTSNSMVLKDPYKGTLKRKIHARVLSTWLVVAILCYVDRTSIAFAAPQLSAQLGFTPSTYGFAAGIFFIGYIIFQVPSNLVLLKLGGRLWLGSLVVAWGTIAACCAALRTPLQFYGLRLALGCAESGTMPGMWYHCSQFYSPNELTEAWSWVLIGIAFSQIIGGPLAAGLLALEGVGSLAGWQWLFLLEGLPTVAMGLFILCTVTSTPAEARFLNPAEAAWLQQRHEAAVAAAAKIGKSQARQALQDSRVWHLAAISLVSNIPKYGIIFFCPMILQQILGGPVSPSLLAALTSGPFAVSAVVVWLNARHSLRTGALLLGMPGMLRHADERWLHVALPLLLAAVALSVLAAAMQLQSPIVAFIALIGAVTVWAPDAVVASWPATFLQGQAAATGVAAINSVGSIGGFIGPYMIGLLKERSSSFALPMWVLAAAAFLVFLLALAFRESSTGPPNRLRDPHLDDDR